MKIEGKVFLVSGGASGLGLAVVKRLVAGGAKVVMADRDEDGAKVAQELGANVAFSQCDVAKEDSVKKAVDMAVSSFGALHGVVNCAGIGLPKRVLSARGVVHDIESFNFVVQVNLIGTFNFIRLAAEKMAKQKPLDGSDEKGVIINVASVAAFEGQIGQAAYSASKGGVVAMTLPIARELAEHGIRINTIAPGLFDTPMMAKLPEKARQSLSKQVPYPSRFGRPEEFADICAEIITNQYLNGTVIRLDGCIRMSAM